MLFVVEGNAAALIRRDGDRTGSRETVQHQTEGIPKSEASLAKETVKYVLIQSRSGILLSPSLLVRDRYHVRTSGQC